MNIYQDIKSTILNNLGGETMEHSYSINGIPVKTGDVICVSDGGAPVFAGQFWRLLGKLIPGDIDHVIVYLGPDGRCVESGPKGVVTFNVENGSWDTLAMREQRHGIIDSFYGVAYPLKRTTLSDAQQTKIREGVAEYCLAQAAAKKPYNLNFFDSKRTDAFYCSQLVYLAYLPFGIDLNTNKGVPDIPGTESIIYPQEIWDGCAHTKWQKS